MGVEEFPPAGTHKWIHQGFFHDLAFSYIGLHWAIYLDYSQTTNHILARC